ncbi:hypothetical protein M3Y97_00865300 [Aphelenchoides bicaudatus]|nr:hypothetical protein M3Y97_00865300 [Aphelenchoides bicaudatus]
MASESDGRLDRESPPEDSLEAQDNPYFSSTARHVASECDRCVLADQRIFYLHRRTRRSYWIPPRVVWNCSLGLEYGVERAIDEFGTYYFLSHLSQTTSYDNPLNSRKSTQAMEQASSSSTDSGQIVVPPIRSYEIFRSKQFNFGFIASSEKPVVIQFVTPGKNEGKLGVVEMIRKSTSVLKLEVAQPPRKVENGASTVSSRRVRFTERITIAGSDSTASVPNFPNVIKIYTENGQIKSLRYNSETTVQEILNILMEKLQISQPEHFAIGIEQSISLAPARISFLPNNLRVQTCVKSSFPDQRFRLRLAFPPRELLNYSKDDPTGFDYFYQQCVNDFVDGRHMEIRYEASLRLAALHIRQVCTETTSARSTLNVHQIEREYGLATFLPTIWLEKIKPRDLREHLQFFLNKDTETFADLQQYLSKQKALNRSSEFSPKNSAAIDVSADISRIVRIKYVTLISLLPDFGIVQFNVNYKPTNVDMVIQLDSRYGIVVRYPGKGSPPAITINFTAVEEIHIYEENETTSCVCLKLAQSGVNAAQRSLDFFVDKKDTSNLVAYIIGYARLFGNQTIHFTEQKPSTSTSAPPYKGLHFVSPAGWNYPATIDPNLERAINFAHGPPAFDQAIVSTNQYDNTIAAEELYNETYVPGRTNKQSPTEYIDEESPTVEMNPMPRRSIDKFLPAPAQQRRRSSQQRFTQMLVGTAHAILLRNRATTKRLRDSLRIHRQRHSVPNANPARSVSPIAERRWSSATRRDTIASTCSTNDNPCISRSALTLRISTDNENDKQITYEQFAKDSSSRSQQTLC